MLAVIGTFGPWACALQDTPKFAAAENKDTKLVGDYYSGIDASSPTELREQLHELISKQGYVSYKSVWSYLDEAYQSESNSDAVVLYYTRRVAPKTHKASGVQQANNDYWNREHVWPQSKGLKRTDARRDLHNIVPADRSVNSSRGNKYFDVGGSRHSECRECFTDHDSWEPPDNVKGDIARIVFYMDVRYDGSDISGAPDLRVVNGVTTGAVGEFIGLGVLQRWHCDDPVSKTERDVNSLAYELQGNRNIFVDESAWVEVIFEFLC